jgi:hypothetical protein
MKVRMTATRRAIDSPMLAIVSLKSMQFENPWEIKYGQMKIH